MSVPEREIGIRFLLQVCQDYLKRHQRHDAMQTLIFDMDKMIKMCQTQHQKITFCKKLMSKMKFVFNFLNP